MSAKIKVIGLSREKIGQVLQHKRPEELLDIIYELATLEPFFSPTEIAAARGVSVRRIKAMCQSKEANPDPDLFRFSRVHKISDNNSRVPLSSIREWDEETAVTLSNGTNGAEHE